MLPPPHALRRRQRRPAEMRGWPVSRILSGPGEPGPGWPFLSPRRCRRGPAANPGLGRKHALGRIAPAARGPYSALLPVGLAVPVRLPVPRWALTPPFHPCRRARRCGGGLFSVALSLGFPRPGVTRHRCFLESGLSSSPGRPGTAAIRPSARRSAKHLARAGQASAAGQCAASPARSARSSATTGPEVPGRKRSRKAASAASSPAAATG